MHQRANHIPARPGAAALALLALLLCPFPASASGRGNNTPPPMPDAMLGPATSAVRPQSILPVGESHTATINGSQTTIRELTGDDIGFGVRDANGGLVRVPATLRPVPAGQTDARELKLKVRELAEQLIAGMPPSLGPLVALPTSFVSQEDFSRTAPIGRFMAEQLIYEFNQRGFPVREYRLGSAITAREGEGEFLLTRKIAPVPVKTPGAVFVVGTYFLDRQAVFVNARLVRGNGEVLRTAQVLLPNTSITRRLTAGGGAGPGAGLILKKGGIPVVDFKTATQPTNLTPIDMGADIH